MDERWAGEWIFGWMEAVWWRINGWMNQVVTRCSVALCLPVVRLLQLWDTFLNKIPLFFWFLIHVLTVGFDSCCSFVRPSSGASLKPQRGFLQRGPPSPITWNTLTGTMAHAPVAVRGKLFPQASLWSSVNGAWRWTVDSFSAHVMSLVSNSAADVYGCSQASMRICNLYERWCVGGGGFTNLHTQLEHIWFDSDLLEDVNVCLVRVWHLCHTYIHIIMIPLFLKECNLSQH